MSFNGSGVFVINSSGQPVVAATLITAAAFNALTADLATGLSMCIAKDGQSVVTANIGLSGFKLTGVGDGTAKQDAATLANVVAGTGVYVATVGGTADAITLTPSPAITAYAAGQTFRFIASGANTTAVTVAISSLTAKAITKNGTTALVAGDIVSGEMVEMTYDGTRFVLAGTHISGLYPGALGTARQVLRVNAAATAPAWEAPLTLATPQASTSGTSIDFTGIPAGVKRIAISLVGVSTNGTSSIIVQLGDSGGIETTGYLSATSTAISNAIATANATTSFIISTLGDAAGILHGTIMLTLENAATFTWTCAGMMARSDTTQLTMVAGSKSTSAELDRVRITTAAGVDTFDAGAINILYE